MESGASTIGALQVQQHASSFKTLEEFYYMVMGIQYPPTPLLITECQWQITGIETPVIIFTLLRREVVNLRFSSWTTSRTNPASTTSRGNAYARLSWMIPAQ